MSYFFEILKGTPWWVFALFGYLLSVGLKAGKPHIIPFKKIFILPILFTAWSFYNLITQFQVTPITSTIWSFSILTGYHLGWRLYRSRPIQVDKTKRLLALGGSWIPLFTFLIIFAARYFFGITFALHPEAKLKIAYYGSCIALSGCVTGLLIGKLLSHIYKYKFTEHTDISPSKRV